MAAPRMSAVLPLSAADAYLREALDRDTILGLVQAELQRAYDKHGAMQWGRHEFYAILKEEVDELWTEIKADSSQIKVRREAIQVIAMCVRYLETGDRYREPDVSGD